MTHRITTDPNRLPTDHYDGYTPTHNERGHQRPKPTDGWWYGIVTHIVLTGVLVALFIALAEMVAR